MLATNDLASLNAVFKSKCKSEDELRIYMKNNKTECALAIFDSPRKVAYPGYIKEAIAHVCKQTDCGCRRIGEDINNS
jgi:putative ATP-dependent endonuclease of OLD family